MGIVGSDRLVRGGNGCIEQGNGHIGFQSCLLFVMEHDGTLVAVYHHVSVVEHQVEYGFRPAL